MSKKVASIIVAVSDDALNNIDQVADHLKAEGMDVKEVMPLTGMIVGSSESDRIAKLKKVDGVLSVEEEMEAPLPPPDSRVQ